MGYVVVTLTLTAGGWKSVVTIGLCFVYVYKLFTLLCLVPFQRNVPNREAGTGETADNPRLGESYGTNPVWQVTIV